MTGMIELRSNFVIERPINCEWLVRQDEKTFEVDLTQTHLAESRRNELITAHGSSLLELANAFDNGYDSACKLYSRVTYESEMATIASRKRRAILLRDEIPNTIKNRGLGTSRSPVGAEDIREALYYEDSEFTQLEQYRAALDAIKELLFGKMMSMQRLCKRAEVLLQHKAPKSNGLGEHDPNGDTFERSMKEFMEAPETKSLIANQAPVRRGFASKERD